MLRAILFMIATLLAIIPVIAVFLAVAIAVATGLQMLLQQDHKASQQEADGQPDHNEARNLAAAGAR